MPTPHSAFAAVAAALDGATDPSDEMAVREFYGTRFMRYPEPVRALVADFLMAQTGTPSPHDLACLKEVLRRPIAELPDIETSDVVGFETVVRVDFTRTRVEPEEDQGFSMGL